MITFIISILALIAGYLVYGKFIERFFGADKTRATPAITMADGVDYISMKPWKMFTIQFLNIAGLGPIFGAILGAMYGPVAYIWIVLGCVFMGAVHDYFSGMLSLRNHGASLPELVGKYLGTTARNALRIFTLILLVMVGVAFVNGPAGLLATLTHGGLTIWLYVIFAYYILATLLPIDKIIGRIYPFFGATLLFMALGVAGYMLIHSANGTFHMNELTFLQLKNQHVNPGQNILFPMIFVVISCGAISGFHSTQSPMMARCMANEGQGRQIFYGAMIAEGIVTLIWATVAINYFGDTNGLNSTLASGHNPAWIVNEVCNTWFGKVGAVIAIIGVVACPITTGDTAFRSARLTIADMFKFNQGPIKNRLMVSIPLFIVGYFLSQIEFTTIWKYLGLFNQCLSVFMLWTAAMYLVKNHKPHWILSLPATFMTSVCISYFLVAPNSVGGLAIDKGYGTVAGVALGLIVLTRFILKNRNVAVN